MCGIIGIIGQEAAAPQLIDALKRLEYRGYDSAGVATLEHGVLTRRRAQGKLKNLEARLALEPLSGTIGIGHTRWATHGRPTENNAHPHATEKLAVVHNGIIENFVELRRELQAKGAKFVTETDTEVVAHLVSQEMERGASPVEAVESGAAAAARRLCARVPVRRRGQSSDRRAQGLAARHRLRRGRDVRRLRRHCAGAVHRHGELSRRRRLGDRHSRWRRGPRRPGRGRAARDPEIASRRDAHRQGQSPPFHGQGDFRAARSRRPYAGQLHRHGGRARGAADAAAVRFCKS